MTLLERSHTFDELFADHDGKLYELVRGQLVEKKMGFLSIWIASEIARLLGNAAEGQGFVAAEVPIKCFPWLGEHGRRPDAAYFRKERLPDGIPTQDPVTVPPDLCVEVLSPNDDAIEVDVKLEEYLRAGVPEVWVVNPATRTVRIHRASGDVRVLHEGETLTCDVIPAFSVDVARIFPNR